eukprot:390866-Rhodomonas_salina.1
MQCPELTWIATRHSERDVRAAHAVATLAVWSYARAMRSPVLTSLFLRADRWRKTSPSQKPQKVQSAIC